MYNESRKYYPDIDYHQEFRYILKKYSRSCWNSSVYLTELQDSTTGENSPVPPTSLRKLLNEEFLEIWQNRINDNLQMKYTNSPFNLLKYTIIDKVINILFKINIIICKMLFYLILEIRF